MSKFDDNPSKYLFYTAGYAGAIGFFMLCWLSWRSWYYLGATGAVLAIGGVAYLLLLWRSRS